MDESHRRLVRDEEVIYYKPCVTCHGADGKGIRAPGTDLRLAPSLADSPRGIDRSSTDLAASLQGSLIFRATSTTT